MDFKHYGRPIDIINVGEGSQPKEEGDENFNFNKPPGEMYTYDVPPLPEPDEVASLTVAKNILKKIHYALTQYQTGDPAIVFDLSILDHENIDLINQVLNEGEVSVIYQGNLAIQIQESVLTGVWRVRSYDKSKKILSDIIEIADIPSIVREQAFAQLIPLNINLDNLPPGVLNSPALTVEITEKSEQWKTGDPSHVINLTLLPFSPEDLNFLGHCLGVGPITILSRGYGNCRIGSTKIKNVWWIKYYNSEDVLILNTIEIIDIPGVALAAQEDIEDSAIRLKEILTMYAVDLNND